MRVLHVIAVYPPADVYTGPPRQVHRLAGALRGIGVDARVITTNANGASTLDVPAGRWTELDGVPVYYGRRLPGTDQTSWDAWQAIGRESAAADVIHVTGVFSWTNLAAAAAARRVGVPVVISPRGSLDPDALRFSRWKKSLFFRLGGSRALKSAAAFHVTSETERSHVASFLPGARIELVPNGVAVPSDADLERWTKDGSAAPTVLFLGRIHPIKNVIALVHSWAAVARRHPDARLVLAGPDDHGHRAEVERTIASLGLGARVRIAGLVGGEELSRLLATSRCLVLPSVAENFGNVVAEALAHRVPVIASTGTPWSGLRDRDCGWWIDPTVDGLAGAIDDALSIERPDRVGKGERGRQWMIEAFSWPSFARRLEAFYAELVSRKGTR